jgi:ATP-dependent helicase STH1/SNF2
MSSISQPPDHSKFNDYFTAPFAKAGEAATLNQEEQWIVISQLHAVFRPFLFQRLKTDVPGSIARQEGDEHSMRDVGLVALAVSDDGGLLRIRDTRHEGGSSRQQGDAMPEDLQPSARLHGELLREFGANPGLREVRAFRSDSPEAGPDRASCVDLFADDRAPRPPPRSLERLMQFKWLRLYGGRKADLWPQLVSDFNTENSEYFAFLLSAWAGGLALNLRSADTVSIYDNDWNPFADQQASARVNHIGQDKEVLVANLSTQDTVIIGIQIGKLSTRLSPQRTRRWHLEHSERRADQQNYRTNAR